MQKNDIDQEQTWKTLVKVFKIKKAHCRNVSLREPCTQFSVHKVDNTIHWINNYPVNNSVSLPNTARFLACENVRFSSLFAADGRFLHAKRPSGEERGETDVSAGYEILFVEAKKVLLNVNREKNLIGILFLFSWYFISAE